LLQEGTGGHIFPAYSLAKYLKSNNYNVNLTTDERGSKYLKNYKNLNLENISSSPLEKKNLFTFVYSIVKIIYSILKSFLFLIFNRPSIIFGMGGYSSFPICVAASILRIKFIIYENNLIIGKANKYLLPFANKIFVSHEELEGIPKQHDEKVFRVGNIVREEIINLNINNKERDTSNIRILVLGGSQAARIFAEVLPIIFKKLKNLDLPIKIYQQCLKKQNNQLSQYYNKVGIDHEIFNFTDKILKYYSEANLVITRSGASVLGELINVKRAFISIPLPSAADNHQYKNAEFYKKKGYGYLIEEKDIKSKLFDLIRSLTENDLLIKNLLLNQRQHSDTHIFTILNDELEEILNENN
jgi:UDP-N-acetylglucosamine--N-acetylmuramyl-(pentapeptide) pyrophosphoryl-undecaprenol N-acetylglucosamine transferase